MNIGLEKKQIPSDDSIGIKILEAAVKIVNDEGFENLTIRRVAKESGCSNSAIYMRFEDKDTLAMAVAKLHLKPVLLVMDENFIKEQDFMTSYNRITKQMLEKLYSFDVDAIHMQVKYNSSMKMKENPVVLRIDSYIRNAMQRGEVKVSNALQTAYLFATAFWGFTEMFALGDMYELEEAKKLLEQQNSILYNGIRAVKGEASLWDILKENGVDVDKALGRMKGNKEAYQSFLKEFFEDSDFQNLKLEIERKNVRGAFEYAHGLKGMAANLGLDEIHSRLSVLVEILRRGSLEGAEDAYTDIVEACEVLIQLL